MESIISMPLSLGPILKKNAVYRLTRTATGLFYPAAGRDALYALGYFKHGYDIVRLDYKKLLREKIKGFSPGPQIPLSKENRYTPGIKDKEQSQSPQIQEQKVELGNEKIEEWSEESYGSLLNWIPYYTGIFDLGKVTASPLYFWGSLEARDPLQWHILGVSPWRFCKTGT